MEKSLNLPAVTLGVCYYPEHWPETLWEDDLRRMREMGLTVVRMAEFAWTMMEPEEGRFTFDFWDRVMDLVEKWKIRAILGTPTATPPAWLTAKYPEVLNATRDGVVYEHGQRRHYNYNAPVYRDLCARIAGKMAERYGDHPALMGWQIDNEFNCETADFHSEADQTAFRAWLQSRYVTLDRLNDAWGTRFWSQTYTDWDQVRLPGPTPSDSPNPHCMLDYRRFVSDSVIGFAQVQCDAIRRFDRAHPITTNGIFGNLDSHRLTQEALDFFSYDSYPMFSAREDPNRDDPLLDRGWGYRLSVTRDISPNFCIMEQQSGSGGWVNRINTPAPAPGQMRLWTWQSIAHGADLVLYFRWRTAPYGTEIYWSGINDCHNRPNRRCAEATAIGAEIAAVGARLAGTRYEADVAILKDYDNEWDGMYDIWHGPHTRQSVAAWYAALQRAHIPADIRFLHPETTAEDLAQYRLLIYPHSAILPDERAAVLAEYARSGGTIVFGCRTGYKDIDGRCPMRPFPGAVADLCGVTVEDFTAIRSYRNPPTLDWPGEERDLATGGFNDILHVESDQAKVVATYAADADYYAGKPALVENPAGDGRALYYGGVFTEPVARAILRHLEIVSPLADTLTLPRDVEAAIRSRDGKRFIVLLNYAANEQTITLKRTMTDLLSGETISGDSVMPRYGVRVLVE